MSIKRDRKDLALLAYIILAVRCSVHDYSISVDGSDLI